MCKAANEFFKKKTVQREAALSVNFFQEQTLYLKMPIGELRVNHGSSCF